MSCNSTIAQTQFSTGDILFCGINTAVTSSVDEVCFFCLKDILPGTSFSLTDNGYERSNPLEWGDSEGAVKWTYNGTDTIQAGKVICWIKPNGLSTNGSIYIDGMDNSAQWTQLSLGLGVLCNLSSSGDQLFIMQGGTWSNPSGSDNAVFDNGKLLAACTINIDWSSGSGTSYSSLPIELACAHGNFSSLGDRLKYTGDTSAGSTVVWRQRIQNVSNWTAYDSTVAYQNGGLDFLSGYQFNILGDTGLSFTTWIGSSDDCWCNCENWSGLLVPDSNTNVVINANALQSAIIPDSIIGFAANLNVSDSLLFIEGDCHIYGSLYSIDSQGLKGSGKLIFTGDSDSVASSGVSFGRVIVDKSAGKVHLLGDLIVVDTLTLLSGVIHTNTNVLAIGIDTNQKGSVVYADGFIKGNVRRWFSGINNDAITGLFPLGDTIYRPITVYFNQSATTGGSILASLTNAAMGSVGLPLQSDTSISAFQVGATANTAYWTLTPDSGVLNDGLYTVEIHPNQFTEIDAIVELTVLKRENGGPWIAPGLHETPLGNAQYPVLSRSGLSGFSDFGVGFGGIFLSDWNLQWDLTNTEIGIEIDLLEFANLDSVRELWWSLNGDDFQLKQVFTGWKTIDSAAILGWNYYKLFIEPIGFTDIKVLSRDDAQDKIGAVFHTTADNNYLYIRYLGTEDYFGQVKLFSLSAQCLFAGEIQLRNGSTQSVDIHNREGNLAILVLERANERIIRKIVIPAE